MVATTGGGQAKPKPKPQQERVYTNKERDGQLFLVDGDENVDDLLVGVENIDPFTKVLVFISQPQLREGLMQKYSRYINLIEVTPGENAVSNRIKAILGNKVRLRKKYQKIFVISQDQSFVNLLAKYRKKLNIREEFLNMRRRVGKPTPPPKPKRKPKFKPKAKSRPRPPAKRERVLTTADFFDGQE